MTETFCCVALRYRHAKADGRRQLHVETVMPERYKIIKNGRRIECYDIANVISDLNDGRIVHDYPRGYLYLGGEESKRISLGPSQNEVLRPLMRRPALTVFPTNVDWDMSAGSFRVVSHRLNSILSSAGYPKMIKSGSNGAPCVGTSRSWGKLIDRGPIDLYLILDLKTL